MVAAEEYITLSHIFLSDSGRNPHSDRNFWNSGTFHLHIFSPLLRNSDRTGDQFYPRNPRNPTGLVTGYSSRINRNIHSRHMHCVTRDCQLTTTPPPSTLPPPPPLHAHPPPPLRVHPPPPFPRPLHHHHHHQTTRLDGTRAQTTTTVVWATDKLFLFLFFVFIY